MRCDCGMEVNTIYRIEDRKFCIFCRNHQAPKCIVCHQPVTTSFLKTDWGNVCETCYKPNLCCFSCTKQLDEKTTFPLSDHRLVCSNCFSNAIYILDQSIINFVFKILSQWKIVVRKPLSYEIVDLNTLLKLRKHNGVISKTVLGQCQTQFQVFPNGKKTISCHKIFILFGLPKEQFIAIFVHELFHAWLHENNSFALTHEDIEFLCDLIAYHFIKTSRFATHWLDSFKNSLNCNQSNLASTLLELPPEKITQGFVALS